MSEESDKLQLSEEFIKEAFEACQINEFDLVGQNRDVINKTQRFIEEYYKQKRQLEKIELHLKKVRGELFEFYKTKFEIKLSSASDINTFIEKDSRYQKTYEYFIELRANMDFLERTIKNMSNKVFALKNLVELDKRN